MNPLLRAAQHVLPLLDRGMRGNGFRRPAQVEGVRVSRQSLWGQLRKKAERYESPGGENDLPGNLSGESRQSLLDAGEGYVSRILLCRKRR